MRGKNAAQARPTSAFAAAMRRSAAAISGRRSSNSLGTATGMPGLASRASFAAASAPFVASSPNAGAGWPVRGVCATSGVGRVGKGGERVQKGGARHLRRGNLRCGGGELGLGLGDVEVGGD